ncbi:MAG: nucleotidyltransferase domain-containing protein [Deltaproteobacteria bacterium]|nr:nucleotidyltransferase domain-containing protein [Deltaproteobacteria bacterium]
MKSAIEQTLNQDVPRLMRRHLAVRSAYVFGSVATGFERVHSDVDVTVRVDRGLTPVEMFDLRLKIADALEDLLGRPVDVVVLNTASLKMIHQVMTTGRRLYAADPEEETAFRLQKRKEYFDFQYYLKDDRKALKAFYGC